MTRPPRGPSLAAALLPLLLLAGAAAALPGGAPREGWPTYRGGSSMAGVAAEPIPPRLARRWTARLRERVSATPVAGGGRFYALDEGGTVTALLPDGTAAWRRAVAGGGAGKGRRGASPPYRIPLLYAGGRVFVSSPGGSLHALDGRSGKLLWTRPVEGGVAAPPAPADLGGRAALLAVSRRDGTIRAVDPATGRDLWRSAPTNRCDGPATATAGRIVYGNCDAAVHVFRARDGAREGSVPTGAEGEVAGAVPFDGATAFAGDRSGRLHAVDAASRRTLWVFRGAKGAVADGPAVTESRVLLASEGGTVHALDRRDGRELWRVDAGGRPGGPVAGGGVVAVAVDGSLLLLSVEDGRTLARVPVGDGITGPAVAYGLVVVGTEEGTVEAFGAAPGGGGGP